MWFNIYVFTLRQNTLSILFYDLLYVSWEVLLQLSIARETPSEWPMDVRITSRVKLQPGVVGNVAVNRKYEINSNLLSL